MTSHCKTGTTPFASSFLLLAVMAGVLHIDLFETETLSGHKDPGIPYRLELVLHGEDASQFAFLCPSEDIGFDDVADDDVLPSQFLPTYSVTDLQVRQIGQVNTRSFYPSFDHSRSFNISHQNSDEDEAFVLPLHVA